MVGKNWLTGSIGVILLVLTWLNQIFVEQGVPKDGKGWIALLVGNATGLLALFAKDFNTTGTGVAATKVDTTKPNG